LRQQQLGIFECTRQSLLHWQWQWLCIVVDACIFEHLISIGNKLQLFFHNASMVLFDFQP
jgi:hypothetical protein